MPVQRVYFSWFEVLRQLWPKERITRVRNMAWLIAGLWVSESIHLSQIAKRLPWDIRSTSIERRFSRFLHNRAVRVRDWYEPVARMLITRALSSVGEVRLILDTTPVHHRAQVVIVSLAFRRRALPLVWAWIPQGKGHSSSYKQKALLAHVRRWIPPDAQVVVVGDSEFGSGALIQQLKAWGWDYVLRQKGRILIQFADRKGWTPLKEVSVNPGESYWYPNILATKKYQHACNLLVHWEVGEKTPWLLLSSYPTRGQTLQAYRRRMWAEEMHRDLKSQGYHLDKTHIRDWQVLSRLFLALALLYVWNIAIGTVVIKRGQRPWVDRRDRRDLSVFRIGSDTLMRRLSLGKPIWIRLVPYFR